jgi:trans-2,3-dihydro-3-hydroxyanthranilate isomerase
MPSIFHTLDVFARAPLTGNPLAVVLDADGLDVTRMQAIAREFNLSETVFVLTPRNPVNAARLRIFTPTAELSFAGHPTVGTAALLAELRASDLLGRQPVGLVLEEDVGNVSCSVWRAGDGGLRASFDLPQLPKSMDAAPASSILAAALSLDVEDLGFDAHHPSVWSAGTPFILVPVASQAALARARPAPEAWSQLGPPELRKTFVYAKETADPRHHVRARMFAPDLGVAEDPATGSAVAAFAGAAQVAERPEDGDHSLFIEQGDDMGRPSLICLDMRIENGRLTGASVGGAVYRILEGHFRI